MSRYHTEARRNSFSMVPETCPVVDKAVETIKEQTGSLRDALIEAIEVQLQYAEERDDFEGQLEKANQRIYQLECDLEKSRSA